MSVWGEQLNDAKNGEQFAAAINDLFTALDNARDKEEQR